MSKVTDRAAAEQMHSYMTTHNPYPPGQSAYPKYHSNKTALLKIMNEILLSMNKQDVTLLVLLNLSAAFDTVDHTNLVLLEYLLIGRSQQISIRGTSSDKFHRVPVLDPNCLLYTLAGYLIL